jgi:hypothetical protein
MTYNEKIAYYLADMRQRGIGQFTAAPPLYRLLWRLGVKVRPQAFASFWSLFWLFTVFYFIACFGSWFWNGHHSITGLVASVVGAGAGGAIVATVIRRRARKLALPRWEDYPSPCPTESSC